MTNKARNIYIDTTGFCEDALRRVSRAIDALSITNYHHGPRSKIMGIDEDGEAIGRYSIYAMEGSVFMTRPRQVWLFELESLAGIR